MQKCRNPHPKVSSPLLPMHLCKTNHPWKKNHGKLVLRNIQLGQMVDTWFEPTGLYFPTNTHETDDRAKRVLAELQRKQKSRVQNSSLLIDDLKELGMYGELSDDNCHINMPFEHVHISPRNDYENGRTHPE